MLESFKLPLAHTVPTNVDDVIGHAPLVQVVLAMLFSISEHEITPYLPLSFRLRRFLRSKSMTMLILNKSQT